MTTLREASEQALEALEEATSYTSCPTWSPSMTEECKAAASALRAALAQQAEPVTGLDVFLDPHDGLKPKRYKAEPVEPVAWLDEEINCAYTPEELDGGTADGLVPLYTAPPQRKPLTEEEIERICMTYQSPRQAARAVERAHGIT